MPPSKAAQPAGPDTDASPAPRRSRRALATPPPVQPAEPLEPTENLAPAVDDDGSWVQADAVEVHQGAIGRVDATHVTVTQGAIGAARGDRISVEMGALGAAMAREVSISQGGAGSILAGQARVEQSFVRTLVAQNVEVRRPSVVLCLIAQRVSGDVRVLMDWRGALAFGAAFGLLAGLVGRARRRG
jgi:hypothetical protein